MNDKIKRSLSLMSVTFIMMFCVTAVSTSMVKPQRRVFADAEKSDYGKVLTQTTSVEVQETEQPETTDTAISEPIPEIAHEIIPSNPLEQKTSPIVYPQPSVITVLDSRSGEIFTVDFEEYVAGVLLSEMPTSFEIEALKAQAVACRTYAVYKSLGTSHDGGAQLCTSPAHCQAYISPASVSPERSEKAYEAVYGTKGEIMLFEGKPVLAVFHASSDKKTRSSQEVWGGNLSYLLSVETTEAFNPEMDITKKYYFSKTDFADKISVLPDSVGTVAIERNASGRVSSVIFPEKTISGADFVRIFSLRSQSFDISFDGDMVVITCGGYGHGVGMSQYGAQDMAQKGYTYRQILSHYYTGISFGFDQ